MSVPPSPLRSVARVRLCVKRRSADVREPAERSRSSYEERHGIPQSLSAPQGTRRQSPRCGIGRVADGRHHVAQHEERKTVGQGQAHVYVGALPNLRALNYRVGGRHPESPFALSVANKVSEVETPLALRLRSCGPTLRANG